MTDGRYEAIKHAAAELERLSEGLRPEVLVILGTGLGAVVDSLDVRREVPFDALPGFAPAAVAGQAGCFVFGTSGSVPVMAMMGRLHLYEGHAPDRVVLPVRAASLLGCRVLVATNAAGGIDPLYRIGQTVMLRDHINLMGLNPLAGPNLDEIGTRFPTMTDAYSPRLRQVAHDAAAEQAMELPEGVYAGVLGPNYETPAEVRALRSLGADLVGMSTVPEVLAARHAGMEVMAFSLVANVAADVTHGHEAVLEAVEAGTPPLARLLTAILSRL